MIALSSLDTRYLNAIGDMRRTYELANAYAWGNAMPRTEAQITTYVNTDMTEAQIQDFYRSFIGEAI